MRRVPVLALAMLLAAAAVLGRSAPAAGQGDFPVTVDPADCAAEPRDVDDVLALWYDDGELIASPADVEAPTEVTIPLGEPVDAATAAAIEATVVAVFACFAAGDVLAATAHFTDELVASFGPEPGTSEEDARAFLEAGEPEDEEGQILAVTDVMDLGDGRVGAFVVEQTAGEPAFSSYAVFVEGEDGWLVDEIVEFSTPAFEEGTPEAATPAP